MRLMHHLQAPPSRWPDMRATLVRAMVIAAGVVFSAGGSLASPFATRVVDYHPAPGQFVQNANYNDPSRALGPPRGGGTVSPDLTSLVSLGGFGGSITLAFDSTVSNLPASARNPLGLDAIVFGNAVFVGGNPNRRAAELGVIEVSLDANHNGLADDPWYLIPGSHLNNPPGGSAGPSVTSKPWDNNPADSTLGPPAANWLPFWAPAPTTDPAQTEVFATSGYLLPGTLYPTPVLTNPNGSNATSEGVHGYADHSPTRVLGDFDNDNQPDMPPPAPRSPRVTAENFYTRPDDPLRVGIDAGALSGGGGDAFDISWAIDPTTGTPVFLPGFDFIRISTGIDAQFAGVNEISTEVDGVARVIVPGYGDYDLDGETTVSDLFAFLDRWFAEFGLASTEGGGLLTDLNNDGACGVDDLFFFLDRWFGGD